MATEVAGAVLLFVLFAIDWAVLCYSDQLTWTDQLLRSGQAASTCTRMPLRHAS